MIFICEPDLRPRFPLNSDDDLRISQNLIALPESFRYHAYDRAFKRLIFDGLLDYGVGDIGIESRSENDNLLYSHVGRIFSNCLRMRSRAASVLSSETLCFALSKVSRTGIIF